MKCPNCGFEPLRGRPKTLDETRMWALKRKGLSRRVIAAKLKVTHGAVNAAIKRHVCAVEGLTDGRCVDCGESTRKRK